MALGICSVAALLVHSGFLWLLWRFSWQSFDRTIGTHWHIMVDFLESFFRPGGEILAACVAPVRLPSSLVLPAG